MRLSPVVRIAAGSLAAILLAASPAAASPATSSDSTGGQDKAVAQAPKAADAKVERKICKKIETTGSRVAEKICLTKAEWKKVDL